MLYKAKTVQGESEFKIAYSEEHALEEEALSFKVTCKNENSKKDLKKVTAELEMQWTIEGDAPHACHVSSGPIQLSKQVFKGKEFVVRKGQVGSFDIVFQLPASIVMSKQAPKFKYLGQRLPKVPIQFRSLPPSYSGKQFSFSY